ncbi:MAG: DUF4859 domain-containing protein [Saprospiraceae bacterium]|nr:DUF4859 domain-containing protein [Saprospiraceae bacterium]
MQALRIKRILFALIFIINSLGAQKTVYIPTFITNTGMNLNDTTSQWCYARSIETENIVVFWEPGFGADPTNSPSPYTVDMKNFMEVAEKSYRIMLDSLKFAIKDSSVTDRYKLMVFLLYTTNWVAYGSGQDNLVGSIFVSPDAANGEHVVAHEIGHGFQYITGCDTEGGFRYGFGENLSGGNGFWEQCAQWMAYQVYPEQLFVDGDYNNYIRSNHLNIIHENTRYANYFITEFWAYKNGIDFIGKLWRDARKPEDPVEVYKRLNKLDQEDFNKEIYEHAARLTSWDIPFLRVNGKDYIHKRSQPKMNFTVDSFWQIDPSICPENYGYNSIKLGVPAKGTEIKVTFKGLAGDTTYRLKNIDQAGWNFGFVALLKDGQRIYSEAKTAKYSNGLNPESSLSFISPENCTHLWLIVTGAPQQHWRHAWDDNNSNDEHWPYKVKFENTDLSGIFMGPLKDLELSYDVIMKPRSNYDPDRIKLNTVLIEESFALPEAEISQKLGSQIKYYAINTDGSLDSNSTAFYPGHWFDKDGKVTRWQVNSFVYSELDINDQRVRIGQFPGACKNGDSVTIRQALIYRRSDGKSARLTMKFNIYIKDEITVIEEPSHNGKLNIYPNPASNMISWNAYDYFVLRNINGVRITSGYGSSVDISNYQSGLYLLKIGKEIYKIVKQ